MIAERIPELQKLSAEDKLTLVGELWDELASMAGAFPRREDHVRLLRERLAEYRLHPGDALAWEDVKARVLASR